MIITEDKIIELMKKMTGQPAPITCDLNLNSISESNAIGRSQLNELLLTLGYDRVSRGFFKLLVNGKKIVDTMSDGEEAQGIDEISISELEACIEEFRKISILVFGNIKYAFKHLSRMEKEEIKKHLQYLIPRSESSYQKRHPALQTIDVIPPQMSHYLGYMISVPNEEIEERDRYRQKGRLNHNSYLVSDHMDVYIATSMRERFEFLTVGSFATSLFDNEHLKSLKLRYFDPTQAYCEDRIDKGLVEGLMLKRALYYLPCARNGYSWKRL